MPDKGGKHSSQDNQTRHQVTVPPGEAL